MKELFEGIFKAGIYGIIHPFLKEL